MKLSVTIAAAALITSLNVNAESNYTFVAADNHPGTQLCMAMTTNKAMKMNNALKLHRLNKRHVVNTLECNNMSLDKFASVYNLDKTGRFLNVSPNTRTSIRDIAKSDKKRVIYVSASR